MADQPTYEELKRRVQQLEQAEFQYKQAKAALRYVQDEMEAILDATAESIVTIDRQGIVLSANRTVCKRLGVTKSNLLGRCIYDLFDPEVAQARRQKWTEVFDSGKPVQFEDIRAGMVFEQNAYPVFNAENLVEKVVVFALDITERKRAEEALRQNAETFRKLFELAPDGIYLSDMEGVFIDGNRAAEEIVGYKKEELIGQSYLTLGVLPPDQLPKAVALLNENLNGNATGPDDLTLIRKDGESVTVEVMTIPITLQNQKAILGIARDISERKKAAAALEESEEKYRNILESIDDGYYEVDLAGNFTFFNDSMCRILGYPREELMGKNNREYMDEDNAKMIFKAFNTVYRTGLSTKALGWKLICKDGSECFVETVVSLITDADKKAIGFRGIARDVTDRIRLEEQLRHAHKMESIGTLAGGVAHDFNNILHMIIGNTELALIDIPEDNPAHGNLEQVKSASLRAAGIVQQLLNFSRKTDREYKPIGAITVLQEALKFLRSTIPTTIEIRTRITTDETIIMADPIQINQVLINICTNAAQAMETSGGVIDVKVENVDLDDKDIVSLPDLSAGEYVKTTIRDTGPGITPEIQDRIFDPYFTTKVAGEGSGMGLAVAHGIVKSHNGAIAVDSQVNQGTVFTIFFPAVPKKPVVTADSQAEIPQGKESILFVDDEETIADMAFLMLERLGYQVVKATDPSKALALFRSRPHEFDLVITDMTMPQMNGVQFSEKLNAIRSDIPVILCTGHSTLIDEQKVKQYGIAAYLAKPITMREMALTIRQVIDAKNNGVG